MTTDSKEALLSQDVADLAGEVEVATHDDSHVLRRHIKMSLLAAGLIAMLLLLYALLPHRHSEVPAHIQGIFVFGLVLFGVILLHLVFRGNYVQTAADSWYRLIASILALVGAILFFALSYRQLAHSSPHAFVGLDTFIDSLYFTIATTLTVGYGDVYAVDQTARAMVICQMVFSVIFIAATARSVAGVFASQSNRQRLIHSLSGKSAAVTQKAAKLERKHARKNRPKAGGARSAVKKPSVAGHRRVKSQASSASDSSAKTKRTAGAATKPKK